MSQQEGSPTGTPAVPTMTGMRRGGLTSARQSCASWGRPHEEPDLPTQSGATSCWDPHAPMGPARVEIARDQEESWDTRNIIQCSPACSPADLQTHPCPTGLLCHPNKTCPALQDDLSTQKQTAGRRGKGHSPPPAPAPELLPTPAQHSTRLLITTAGQPEPWGQQKGTLKMLSQMSCVGPSTVLF